MTYKPSKLSVLAYANGFTLWHYKSDTTITKTKVNEFLVRGRQQNPEKPRCRSRHLHGRHRHNVGKQ